MRPYLDLFFMGAAFLLLETMNVVRFALWFGTTWFVNALVFFGILVAVLLAVEIARRVRLPGTAFLYAFARDLARDRLAGASVGVARPSRVPRGCWRPPRWRSSPSSWRT